LGDFLEPLSLPTVRHAAEASSLEMMIYLDRLIADRKREVNAGTAVAMTSSPA